MFLDTTVVIRSIGERTEQVCKKLILDQGISKNQVHLVREIPFSQALYKSYEIGIDSGCKWTLCVDADVQLRPGSISEILRLAEKQNDSICEIQGFMMDKYFGGIRKGGIHLYRSSLLPLVKEQIPNEGDDIRPETQTLCNMKKLGYNRAVVSYVVGIHDDEQFNKDIYRKAFVHGVKHMNRLPLFVTLWKERLSEDSDFEVALFALSESIKSTDQLYINAEKEIYSSMFEKSGFKEKNPLRPKDISLESVEKKIQHWKSPDLYFSYFPTRDGYDSAFSGLLKKVSRFNKRYGTKKLIKIGFNKITK